MLYSAPPSLHLDSNDFGVSKTVVITLIEEWGIFWVALLTIFLVLHFMLVLP